MLEELELEEASEEEMRLVASRSRLPPSSGDEEHVDAKILRMMKQVRSGAWLTREEAYSMLSTAGASVEEEEVKASSNGKVSLLDIMKVCFPWTPTRVLQERCMHAMREEEDGLKEEVRRSCHERRLSREQQAIVHALFALADEQGNNKILTDSDLFSEEEVDSLLQDLPRSSFMSQQNFFLLIDSAFK
ncbi:hypothetical protein GUITHDRAFT_145782 [Guillardia theta CCMP2712]|uniref:Uncharacterized protein n=1 Tax=Guillardia theta (strain CCMP2712) TaxID=905079 RepID=L1IJJ2_GUITC|nr:hypothetical protein GUITHDRAFT_145782 [Guillardia theta CCMP2712]EKX36418.1 hypothetical protein GUITHDRAFT_145782 [Guillardia theta CCMP2712]|eukprot:XP_005823398.1 hypothetical protein GUITHDRAFT_145782 [Guillardia theta CCMP2712]